MPLVWVTGNSGTGKSAVCAFLSASGQRALDADGDGFSHWVGRDDGTPVADPPYPVPGGWLDRFGWQIDRVKIEALAAEAAGQTAFLCGSAENEADVRDLFDLMICLVVDSETLRERLQSRTTNAFGQQPEELAAALRQNEGEQATYRAADATIIDASQPIGDVAAAILAAAATVTGPAK